MIDLYDNRHAGRLIARVEFIGETSRPGPLNGQIEVALAGEQRQPALIPVYGDGVQDVACRPSTLILPRRAGGRFVYSGSVHLRQRDGQAIRVDVENAPPATSVQVRPSPESGASAGSTSNRHTPNRSPLWRT